MSNGLNTQEGQFRERERIGAPIPRVPYDYAGWRRQSAPLPRVEIPIGSQTPADFGESRFDSRVTLPQQLDNLNEFRAEEQTSLGKIANGIAKMGVFAGTTFLDGTVGLLYGAGSAIAQGDWSGLWDNEISNAMSDAQRWSEKALPNYYTESELDGNIHFTANFMGDKFLKNLGFTFGAIGSALLFNKGVGLLKLPKVAEYLTKSKQASAVFSFLLGNAVQSLNEARVEANNNSREWYETQKQQLDDYHERRKEELLSTAVDEADYARLSALEDDAYQRALQRLGEDTAKMGNADMAGNFGLLMLTNSMGLGRMYARGFNTQRRILNASKKMNKLKAGEALSTGTGRGLLTGLKDTFMEGAEEMSQSMIAKGMGNYYGNDVMSFYDASIDFGTTKNSVDMLNAMGKGIHEQLNDPMAWEEFLIGSLTGATGMIRVGEAGRNADVHIAGSVGLQGGILGATMEARRNAARENAILKKVNEDMAKPNITAMLRGINRHVTEQGKMDLAAQAGDSKAYKDAEYSQLISDIITFDVCGMLTDYKNLINTTLGNGHLTDEQLKSIREATKNVVDGKDIGPYAEFTEDADGNNKMREKLEQTRKALLDAVDQYQAAYKEIDMQTDGIFSEDQLAELVWMKTRLGDWNKRSKELTSSIVDRLKNLKTHVYTNNDGDLNQFLTVNAVEGEELTPQKLSAYLKSSGKRHIDIDKSVDALISIIEKNKNMLGPMLVSKADPKSNTTLFLGIQAWINHLQDEAKKDTVITDGEDLHLDELMQELRDLQQMTLDAQEFNSKLTEFMADPKKFEAAHKKSNRKAKKAETKQKAKDTIAKAQQATTKEEAQSIMDDAEPQVKNEMKNDPWVIYFNKKNDYLGQLEGSIDALEDIPDVYKNGAIDTLEDVFRFIQDPKTLEDFAKNPWSIINQLGLNTDPYVNYIIDSAFKKQLSNKEFAKLFSAYTPPVDGSVVFTKPESSKDGPDSNNPSVEPEPVSPEDKYTPAIDEPVSVPENAAEKVNTESNASVNPNPNGIVNFLQTGLPQIAIEDRVKKDKTTGQRTLPSDYNTPSWVTIDEKLPVNREAAWNYIYTTNDSRTITYKDLIMSPEFTKGSEIYFGIKPNIYYQTEKDVTSGNKSYVVFMYYKYKDNYVPVGTIITIDDENEYFGAVPLIERITNDYKNNTLTTVKDMLGDDIFISPVLSTKVHNIESGFIPYLDHGNNLKDVVKPEDINTKVRFSIVKNKPNQPGVFEFAGASDIANKIYHNPLTLSAWSGRIVMLIPRPDGKYNPVPILTKSVTAEDIVNNKTAPFYQDIYNTIVSLLQADNTFDASELVKQLRQLLYIGNTRIGYYNEKTDGTGYTKVKDEYDKNEANDLFQVLGFVNRTDYDEWDNNRKNGQDTVLSTRHLIKTGNTDTDVTNFINTILEVAGKHEQGSAKIYYNIDTSRLKDTQYIQDIINGSLLTCNIEKPETYGDFFTIPTYDPSTGQMFTVGTPASTNNPTNPRVIANPSQNGRSLEYSEYTNFYGSNYKGFVGENGVVRFYVGSMSPNNLLRSTATVTLGDGVTVPVVQVLEQIHYLHDNTHTNLYSRETKSGFIYKGQVAEVCVFNGIDNYIFVKTGDRYDIITNPNDIQTIKTTIQANKAASQIAAANTVQPQAPTNLAVSYNGVKSSSEGVYNGTKAGLDVLSTETHEGTIEDIYYVNNKGEVIHAAGYKLPNSKVYLTARAVFKGTENTLKVFFINENGYRSNSSLDVSLPVTLGADNIPTSFIANTVNEIITSNPNIRKSLDDATNALTSTDTSKDLRRFQVQEAAPQVTAEVPSAPSVIPKNNPVRLYLEGMTNQFSTTDASGKQVVNRTGGVYTDSFGHNYLRFHCMQGYFSDKEPSSFSIASNDPSRKATIVSEPIIEGNIYDTYLRSYFIYGDTNHAAQEASKAYEDFMRNVNPELRAIYDDKYKNKYLPEVQTKFKDVINVYNRLKKAGYKFLTNNLIVSAALPYAEDKSNANPVTKYLRMAGEMDMLMEKDGEYYIVDFKNSRSNPSANEFYRTQLAFYKYALETSMPELKGKVHTYGWIWHDKTSDHDALIRPDNNEDINLANCAIPTSANDVASMLIGNKPTNSLFFSRVAEKAAMELQANAGTVVQTSVEPKQHISTKKIQATIKNSLPTINGQRPILVNNSGLEIPVGTDDTYRLTLRDGTVVYEHYGARDYKPSMSRNEIYISDGTGDTTFINADQVVKVELNNHNGTYTTISYIENNSQKQLEELINHLRESGFTVKGKADMEKFLQENDLSDVQEQITSPEVEKEMQQIKDKAIADGTFGKVKNKEGKLVDSILFNTLGERAWLHVRTKNFKNWFGDWENDPANASKAVDENGEPKPFYHGTIDGTFRTFEFDEENERGRHLVHDLHSIFFTDTYEKALKYKHKDVKVMFLNMRNPGYSSVLDGKYKTLDEYTARENELIRDSSYDSVIITRYDKEGGTKPTTQWVLKDPNQAKDALANNGNYSTEKNDTQELRTSDGTLYGFVDKDNNIYIDESFATLDTPVHEYTHLWDRVVAKENPELWQRGVDLMKQLPLWSEIENDPSYGGKWNNRNDKEFLIASEVHARIVGKQGEKVLKDHSDKPAIQALKDWLKEFWQAVKDTFAKWTNQDLASLNITDFINMPIRDFVNKEDLLSRLNAPTQPVTAQQPATTISTTEEQLGDLLRVVDETTDTTPANFDKELAWLKSHLGISENDGLEVIDTLINVNEHGLQAYGQFKDATIKLSRMMTKGTAYHEAFHAVFHLMLKPSEICAIVDEAQKLYNITDALELEEKLANDFMEYMLDEEYVKPTLTARIKAFFTKLKRYLNHVLGIEDYLDNLFYKIKSGNFVNAYSQDMAKSSTNATLISRAILANNGRSLDTTPDGQRSELYDALKRELEGTEEAIIAKAMTFSPDFIGWLRAEHAGEDVYYPNGEVKSSFVLERLKQLGITDLHSYIPYNLPIGASDVDQGGRKISVKRYTKLVNDALNNIPASKLKTAYNKFVKDYLNKYGIEIIGTVKDKAITIKDVIDRRKHLNVFNTDGSVKSRQQIKADNKQVHAGSWETLTTRQHQLLAADNINEQLWNSLNADEQENILSCL